MGSRRSAADPLLAKDVRDLLKYEVAQELGVPLGPGYNGHLTAKEAGAVGGKIGGSMVRVMVRYAQAFLLPTRPG